MSLLTPPPVPTDSTNDRQHRRQIATGLNGLLKSHISLIDNVDGTLDPLLHTIAQAISQSQADRQSVANQLTIQVTGDNQIDAEAALVSLVNAVTKNDALTSATANATSFLYAGILAQGVALAAAVTQLNASIGTTNANLTTEQTARASGDAANASSITSLTTTVNGNTANITTLQSSVNGLNAQWGVSIDINGHVTGLVRLDSGATQSSFTVVANDFKYLDPTAGATPLFQITGGVAYFNAPLNAGLINASTIIANNVIIASHITPGAVTTSGTNTASNVAVTTTSWVLNLVAALTYVAGTAVLYAGCVAVKNTSASSVAVDVSITGISGIPGTFQPGGDFISNASIPAGTTARFTVYGVDYTKTGVITSPTLQVVGHSGSLSGLVTIVDSVIYSTQINK